VILLTSTTDLLEVVTSGAQTVHVQASYVDLSGSTVTPGRLNTIISSATTTTVVGSPAASTQRTVKFLSIQNTSGTSETVTVEHTDGTNVIQLQKLTLLAGYTLVYNEGSGWTLYDGSANIQMSQGSGRFLKRTVILNGTTTFTTSPNTNSIIARMVAGGGQGGGAPAVAGECGSGGGAGSYAEWQVAVSPSTGYTVAVGAGGSTSGTGAAGQTGGVTTFAVGATTVTCNGGVGGNPGTSIALGVLGGAGGAVSTNGTLNAPGAAGEPNICTGTAADNRSGGGANSQFGNGGAPLFEASGTTGNAAGGFGAGGGGASTTGTAEKGGTGSNGVIIVDEYS
jgi:hypothetical protein